MPSSPIEILKSGNSYLIEGILDDGTVDSDGQVLDPAWLREAAFDWLSRGTAVVWTSGHVTGRRIAGVGQEVRAEGAQTVVRVNVTDMALRSQLTALARDGQSARLSVGIARPAIVRDGEAPMGRITGGTIDVYLDSDPLITRKPEPKRPGN